MLQNKHNYSKHISLYCYIWYRMITEDTHVKTCYKISTSLFTKQQLERKRGRRGMSGGGGGWRITPASTTLTVAVPFTGMRLVGLIILLPLCRSWWWCSYRSIDSIRHGNSRCFPRCCNCRIFWWWNPNPSHHHKLGLLWIIVVVNWRGWSSCVQTVFLLTNKRKGLSQAWKTTKNCHKFV